MTVIYIYTDTFVQHSTADVVFIQSFIYSIIRLFDRLFVRSFIHSFVHSFFHSFIHPFIHSGLTPKFTNVYCSSTLKCYYIKDLSGTLTPICTMVF